MSMLAKTVAAAFAVSLVSTIAVPAFAQDNTGRANERPIYFDLGIDVTQLPRNVADARKYLAAQAPETQRALIGACTTYLQHPADAQMPETLVFCAAIIN
jgi:hypothetical protein